MSDPNASKSEECDQIEQTVVDPDVTNFGLGYPSLELLPSHIIGERMLDYPNSHIRRKILQYGFVSGYRSVRVKLAGFIKTMSGRDVDPERLFVTNGISGGLHLVCSLLTQTGDTVFVEDASYFIGIRIFQSLGLRIRSIPTVQDQLTNEGGVDFEHLEWQLERGPIPKFFYVIPYGHNPRGYSWSEPAKQRLIELSEKYGFHVVSDEVYEFLHFSDRHPYNSFHHRPNKTVVSLNTFSKILGPGLRLGWIESDPGMIRRLCEHPVIVSGGGMNPVGCFLVEDCLQSGLERHILELRGIYRGRRDALIECLDGAKAELGLSYAVPGGGYFVWVEFPQQFIGRPEFLQFVFDRYRVRFQPGINFNVNRDRFHNCMRLCYSFYGCDRIRTGMSALFDGYREYLTNLRPAPDAPVSPHLRPLLVHGCTGRMGSAIMAEGEYAGSLGFQLVGLHRDYKDLPQNGVVIDVTSPEGLSGLLNHLTGQALIVGTTGQLPEAFLREYALKGKVIMCSNFSTGVRLMKGMLALVGEDWSVDIVELHHSRKRDNPSGTALDLAKRVHQCGSVHGIRAGSNFGEHIVFLQKDGEKIELRHQCLDRRVFGRGAIRLARDIVSGS